jgi:hypothetical protein
MKQLLLAVLLTTSITAEAKLCVASTDTGKKVFMFVADKPTKSLSGTVASLEPCPQELLYESPPPTVDECLSVVLTYVNRFTNMPETYHYKNGAISEDGINWSKEQNPGCPALP